MNTVFGEREVGTIALWHQTKACRVRVEREMKMGGFCLLGDGVEVNVIAWYSAVVECQRHACTHVSWLRESHIIKEVSLIEKVSENDGVNMLWHLWSLFQSHHKHQRALALTPFPTTHHSHT